MNVEQFLEQHKQSIAILKSGGKKESTSGINENQSK